jgi:hypothetical protein
MKAGTMISTYKRMRLQPLWRLLASNHGPMIICLLQTHLYEGERSLPGSIFFERLHRDLEELRGQGEDFPQTAQAYVSNWLGEGYLERRFPVGATEEVYELSTATVDAIRIVAGLAKPHSAATESRLTLVIEALSNLAEDTDTDQSHRRQRLLDEKASISKKIKAMEKGMLRVLPETMALERTREILKLADDLAGDFRRVRDRFEQLNRELRERIMDHTDKRGEVLDSLFAGIDLIAESEAGKSFSAFWRLLTNPEQSMMLDHAIDSLMSRNFAARLEVKERRFLRRLPRTLLEQGGMVHEVLQTFARSLKHFVQSREYLEHRRLNQLLKEAHRTALLLKNEVKSTDTLAFTLELTSSRIRSLSQWVLFDPSLQALPTEMLEGQSPIIDVDSISQLIAQSEIDFRTLRVHVQKALSQRPKVSIGEVLELFPADQGLGSVMGLMALGSRHGTRQDSTETVAWLGMDHVRRSARIPIIFFLKERMHELV